MERSVSGQAHTVNGDSYTHAATSTDTRHGQGWIAGRRTTLFVVVRGGIAVGLAGQRCRDSRLRVRKDLIRRWVLYRGVHGKGDRMGGGEGEDEEGGESDKHHTIKAVYTLHCTE